MVFEDLHWCDEASMDLLIETAKLVDELPCLFLFAFRPERQAPSWRLKQWLETEYPHRSTEIALSPLSPQDSGVLIDRLLPDDERSEAVRTQILERTEGNPLFVEEMASAVLDRGSGGAEGLGIPTTLQALITARLDTLDEETRRTLQLASVIGRSFLEPVLRAVSGDGDDLGRRLGTLERVGLIAETVRTPEREYAFRHTLIQEATYGTILLRGRRELHLRVAQALEERYANRLEEFAPLLARHFEEAGDDERTLRYATAAGDNAARLYANAEAVTHYASAIEAAGRLGRTGETLHHLYASRGRGLELAGRFDEAVANYEEMRTAAEGSADRTAVLDADMALATLFSTPTPRFDAERGRELSERTLALAQELGERVAESKALWNLMILDVFGGGDLREAIDVGERSLAIARETNAREQMAFTLNDLARPYMAFGDLGAARESLEEATPIWRELGNLPMLSENLASLGTLRRLGGDDAGAIALSDEAFAIAEGIGNLWGQAYGLLVVYGIYLDRGEIGRAIATMERASRSLSAGGSSRRRRPPGPTSPPSTPTSGTSSEPASFRRRPRGGRDPAADRSAVGDGGEGESPPAGRRARRGRGRRGRQPSRAAARAAPVHGDGRRRARQRMVRAARGDHAGAVEAAETILDRLRVLGIRQFVPDALLLEGRSLAAAGRSPRSGAPLAGSPVGRGRAGMRTHPMGSARRGEPARRREEERSGRDPIFEPKPGASSCRSPRPSMTTISDRTSSPAPMSSPCLPRATRFRESSSDNRRRVAPTSSATR